MRARSLWFESPGVAALREAMLAVDTDARGRATLELLGFRGIEAAQDAQWNDIRALGIDTLANLLRP